MAKKNSESAPNPKPTEMQEVAELKKKIEDTAVSLSKMTDIMEQTVALSELISLFHVDPDSTFGKELAVTKAHVEQVAKEGIAMAKLLAIFQNEVNKL